ncbi:MAG: uracil-DNA glycosylase [Pararhizobium sp.]
MPSLPSLECREPDRDCPLCPRLHAFVAEQRIAHPEWHNAPVATWYPAEGLEAVRLLVVGLAPGLRGANRTGRPFTGDYAGDLLYRTLDRYGFSRGTFAARPDDGLTLVDAAVTNAVRCVPPMNKPIGAEIATCRRFLAATLAGMPRLKALLTLGKIAHETTVRALGARVAAHAFTHGGRTEIHGLSLFSSYHCSRYNTNTGRLTEAMFDSVFREIRTFLDEEDEAASEGR